MSIKNTDIIKLDLTRNLSKFILLDFYADFLKLF